MKKKVISLITAISLIMASTLTVFANTATNVENTGTGYTASTSITAEITAEMLGEDVVVTVPSSIQFSSESSHPGGTNNLEETGTVTAKGVIDASHKLYIGIVSDVDYYEAMHNTIAGFSAPVSIEWAQGTSTTTISNSSIPSNDGYVTAVEIDSTSLANFYQANCSYILNLSNVVAAGTYFTTIPYYVAVCEDTGTYGGITF